MNIKPVLFLLGLVFFFNCTSESSCDNDHVVEGSAFSDQAFADYDPGLGIIDPMDGMNFYYGNLHSHTMTSTGSVTPAEAFTWARDVAGYDFYAMTDHAERTSTALWEETGIEAGNFSAAGVFLAIRGFEWSHDTVGHVSIFNTTEYTTSEVTRTLDRLAEWIDDHSAYAQYNHPGRTECLYRNLSYFEQCADNIVAIETGNKEMGIVSGLHLPAYPLALSRGWRFAPTDNQDNHTLETNSHRTVIISPTLDMNGFLDAMGNRRMFASDSPGMRIIFKIGAHWMGSTVRVSPGVYVLLIMVENDEPLKGIALIDGLTGETVLEIALNGSTSAVTFEPQIQVSRNSCYYLKVTSVDTNNDEEGYADQMAVTSPIWLKVD